jgi:hypothetical protein
MPAGLGRSKRDFKMGLAIEAKAPEMIPAVNKRGANISKGKAIAKTPHPFPKKVSQAQTVSGSNWVNWLMKRKLLL